MSRSQKKKLAMETPNIPALEKLVPVSAVLGYTNKCMKAVQDSVAKVMQEHALEPEVHKEASLFLDGATMLYKLISHGLTMQPEQNAEVHE